METKYKIKYENHICRALIEPSTSENKDEYDFVCVASPFNNGQVNYSIRNDEFFKEVLLPTQENTRTKRMESGLPLFDNHPYNKKATAVLGVSVGYEFTERGIELKMKWGARADDALKADIANGITKTVSIEADIYEYEIERKIGELPIYKTTDWEPTSISIAPVPQDIESQIEVKRAIVKQINKEIEGKKEPSLINSITNKF